MGRSIFRRMTPMYIEELPKTSPAEVDAKRKTEEDRAKTAEPHLTPDDALVSRRRQELFDKLVKDYLLVPRQVEMLAKANLRVEEGLDPVTGRNMTVLRGEIKSDRGIHLVELSRVSSSKFTGFVDGNPLNSDLAKEWFSFYLPVARVLEKLSEPSTPEEETRDRLGDITDELLGKK